MPDRPDVSADENPVGAVLARNTAGLSSCANYLVLPAPALGALPLPLQHQLAHVLAYLHHATASWAWPSYRVRAETDECVADLTPAQRLRAGISCARSAHGEPRYHWIATGAEIPAPERTLVRVPHPDPLIVDT